jgi:hypothetical protein
MVGSSPRCADSFSPTKSRNRLSDVSLGPDWRILVHQIRVLSVFFPLLFWTVREYPNAIRVLSFVSGIRQQKGIPVKWGEVSFVVDHPLSRRCGKGFILTIRHSTQKTWFALIAKHDALTFEDVASGTHTDIELPHQGHMKCRYTKRIDVLHCRPW